MVRMRVALVTALLLAACTGTSTRSGAATGTATSADGVSIAFEVRGEGPKTIVLVHGWSCDRTYWRQQMDSFPGYRVIALDLAGHGASGNGRTGWSVPNFANDVAAVIKAVDADDVVLVGHSLGGPVAVEAGLLLPDRVIGVVGVDAFFDGWASPEFAKAVSQLRPDFAARTRAFVRNALFLPTSRPALADSIAADMASAPPEVAMPAIDSLLAWARDRQDSVVAALRAPAGLIMTAGGRGATARFQSAREGRQDLGIEEVPGAGHFLMVEAPAAFNTELRAMLGRIGEGGSS